MVRISEEYQEVEYVESSSDGDPFILTDILMPKEIVCYHTFTLLQYKDQYGWGAIGNGFSGAGFGQYAYKLQYNYSGSYKYAGNPAISIGKKYSTKLILLDGRQEVYVDGVQGQSWNKANTKDGENIRIALFRANGFSLRGAMRMYYIKFTNADESIILGEFIPCYRKSDNEIGMYDTVSKTFYTNSGTGTFLKGHNVYYNDVNLLEQHRKILLNTPHLETIQNNIATFNTDMNVSLKDCKIHFSPIQEGEGDPSPENVRPISGWDGITITKCGKNLLPTDDPKDPNKNYVHSSTGSIDFNQTENAFYSAGNGVGYAAHYQRNGPSSSMFIAPTDMTITLSLEYKNIGTSYGLRLYKNSTRLQDIHGVADNTWHIFTKTFDLTKGDSIGMTYYKDIYWRNIQIEIGSEATSFEPYISSSIDIPFSQAIYGGYVDLIKGEVVDTWVNRTVSELNVNKTSGSGSWEHRYDALSVWIAGSGYESNTSLMNKVYCDMLARGTPTSNNIYTVYASRFSMYDDTVDTASAFKEKWANCHFVYPVLERYYKTYPLTPQTIKTLKGINNIFSDANGNIEVTYWTH